jgi:hypothetical protein
MRIRNIPQPRQRLPYSQKNKEWRKENLDFADTHSFYHNEEVRKSLKNKSINLNLYNGIVDIRDLTDVVNPHHLDASYIPDNIPHHPIVVPKIDLLVGEESKRRFDYYAVVTNPDAISKKEEDKKKFLMQKLTEMLEMNYQDDELKAKMEELGKYMKYSWSDIREKMANQILKHYYQEQDFANKFLKGFKDALIMAEEIYLVDISHNEPTLTKLNPLKVRAIRSGNSDKFEDASMIIMEDHKSPSQLVDEYYDELKPEEIDYLMNYSTKSGNGSYSDDHNNHALFRDGGSQSELYDGLLNVAELNGHTFGSDYTDENGNIRELKLRWKSLRKVKKIKFYDDYGETQYRFESEEYKTDKVRGEEETIFWINEGWEGTKLGKDIYLKMKPLSVQYVKANNPSKGHLGIIGQIYNTNQGIAVSLMDRAKNYQYMYDALFDRLNKAISTNYGKILELDLAKVPSNWEIEKWMHFAVVNKIAVVDSFKEGNHGAATGKLAGSMSNGTGSRSIDMETGSYIQQHIQLLEFIKMEMGEICGVSAQREGQISNRETVGGVERSVNQSSHITEYWFILHESVKIRVLEAFLETAKVALRNSENKKVQYILDDQTIEILNMEGEQLAESDYGILITSTAKTMELEQAIKQYAQAFIQNGGSMSTIMDIYFSPSLSDMRRKLETAEEEIQRRNSEQAQEANKIQQEANQATQALEQQKLQLEEAKNIRDNETKIYIAELGKEMSNDVDSTDGIDNPLEQSKFELDVQAKRNDYLLKIKALDNDMKKHADNVELKKESNSISRIKKKSTT